MLFVVVVALRLLFLVRGHGETKEVGIEPQGDAEVAQRLLVVLFKDIGFASVGVRAD